MKTNIKSQLKSLLGIDEDKALTKKDLIDMLDALPALGKANTLTLNPGSIKCIINGRSDSRMKYLERRGIVRNDNLISNNKHNFYRITKKGYNVLNISQKYLA